MKKSLVLLGFKILSALFAYLVNVLIARLYPTNLVGNYFLFTTCIIIASSVVKIGLDLNTIKVVPILLYKNKVEEIERYISNSISAILTSSLLVAAPLGLILYSFTKDMLIAFFSALTLICYALKDVLAAVLRASKKYFSSSLVLNISVPLVSFILFVVIYINEQPAMLNAFHIFIISSAASLILAFSLIKLTYNYRIKDIFKSPNAEIFKIINFTKYQITLVNVLIIWIPNIIIGIFYDAENVAIFNISNRTAIFISFIYIAVENYIGPKISSDFEQNNNVKIQNLLRRMSILSTAVASFFFGFCFVFSKDILSLFGAEYAENNSYLIVLSAAQFINVLSGNAATYLMMTGREKKVRDIYTIVVCSMIVLLIVVSLYFKSLLAFVYCYSILIAFYNLWFAFIVKKNYDLNVSFLQMIQLRKQ